MDRKDAGALPDLRRIASDPALVSTLRKVAIHAIGQLGTAEGPTVPTFPTAGRGVLSAKPEGIPAAQRAHAGKRRWLMLPQTIGIETPEESRRLARILFHHRASS